jgi:hypothetical protein
MDVSTLTKNTTKAEAGQEPTAWVATKRDLRLEGALEAFTQ